MCTLYCYNPANRALHNVQAQAAVDECARLPLNDPLNKFLTAGSVNKLWGSLLHPPLSYRGGNMQYRTADGKSNVRML